LFVCFTVYSLKHGLSRGKCKNFIVKSTKIFKIIRKILDREDIRDKPIVLISVAGELDVFLPNYAIPDLDRNFSIFSGSPIQSKKDPGFRIRIRIKEKVFLTQNLFLSSRKNDLGCSSLTPIFSHPGSQIRIPVPGVRKAPNAESWIRNCNTSETS
jgi:hypothetical protein